MLLVPLVLVFLLLEVTSLVIEMLCSNAYEASSSFLQETLNTRPILHYMKTKQRYVVYN